MPECPADTDLKVPDLTYLGVNLQDGNGLVVESFCWHYGPDNIQNEGHLHHEYLFNDLIHMETIPKNQDSKSVIFVNGTNHAFKADLATSHASCEAVDMSAGAQQWDAKSLHVLSELTGIPDHVSLSWILANLYQREWTKRIDEEQGLITFVYCKGDDGPKMQLTFLKSDKDYVAFDDLIQVLVVPENEAKPGYFLFDVYNVDKLDAKNTNALRLQQSLGIFQPPEGIVCTGLWKREQPVIQFPDQMSMSTELVDFQLKNIFYTSEFYDYTEKLVRIELHSGYTPGFVSPRHSRPRDDVHPVKYVRDFEYGLGFWQDMETGDCGIHAMRTNGDDISKEMFPSQMSVTNKSLPVEIFKMLHPSEIYDFGNMFYTGRCLSQSHLTGLRYLHVQNNKLTEACFSDGTWNINTLNNSMNVPFYRKTFDLSRPREGPDFTPYLAKVTHFYDVEFHEPDASYFDISECVSDSSLTRHYILKTKASSELLDPDNNNEPFAREDQRSPLFKRMPRFVSAMKASLQDTLQLPGVRVYDVFAEEPITSHRETAQHSLLIGFAVLDFPPDMLSTYNSSQMNSVRARGVYQSIDNINRTLYGFLKKEDDFVLKFQWVDYYRRQDGKTVNGTFRELLTVASIMEVNEAAFKSKVAAKQKKIEAAPEQQGEGIGAGAVIAVAFCMALLGVGVGIALGWKLWKSGTSFGYTIHTNI